MRRYLPDVRIDYDKKSNFRSISLFSQQTHNKKFIPDKSQHDTIHPSTILLFISIAQVAQTVSPTRGFPSHK